MAVGVFLWISIIFLGTQVHLSTQYSSTDAATLIASLMTGYSADVRPSDGTVVELSLGLMSIGGLDIVAETFNIAGYLMAKWDDSRLSWTPASYGNLNDIMIKPASIWTPPLVLSNAAGAINFLNDNTEHTSNPTKVLNTGSVLWLIPVSLNPSCSSNVQYYPFDQQSCDITLNNKLGACSDVVWDPTKWTVTPLTTWMYTSAEVFIYVEATTIEQDLYSENGEWEIKSVGASNESITMAGYPTTGASFSITAERRSKYYVLNLILPLVLLSLLGPLVFLLPVESGDKIGFTLTILLSLSVFITVVADHIPTTATHTCIMSVYILTVFIVCTLETLVTVLSITFHGRHGKGYPLAGKKQSLSRALAKLVIYRRPDDGEPENKVVKTPLPEQTEEAWKAKEQDQSDYNYEDLSTILDRLCFFVFSILTVISTIVFMLVISTGSD